MTREADENGSLGATLFTVRRFACIRIFVTLGKIGGYRIFLGERFLAFHVHEYCGKTAPTGN